jgi:hypothetical protein
MKGFPGRLIVFQDCPPEQLEAVLGIGILTLEKALCLLCASVDKLRQS